MRLFGQVPKLDGFPACRDTAPVLSRQILFVGPESPGSRSPALGWLALLAVTSQVIGWLLITVSMPRLPAGMIGAPLLVQQAGSVALSYAILGERPSILQLAGVVLVLAGVVAAVSGAGPAGSGAPSSRRSTRIIRQAPAASTGVPASKSP